MRILYVVARAIEINTSASIRNRATIIGLTKNGHDVTIISTSPDRKHPSYDSSLTLSDVRREYFNLGGLKTINSIGRRFKLLRKIKSVVYNLMRNREIYDNLKGIVRFAGCIDLKQYDLIISSSDPKSSHLFVDKLLSTNLNSIPWIQIWGDPFADDITILQSSDNKKIIKEERRLLMKADKIVYVSNVTCNSQKYKYPEAAGKMFFYPTPYSEPHITEYNFPSNLKDIKMSYCGDYSSKIRNITPLYESALELNINLTICGLSDLKLDKANNINILTRQSSKKTRDIEDNSDILVHISNLKGTQIPGKIFQYAATNKVILFILDGESKEIRNDFEKYNRFVFVENTKDEIVNVLKNIHETINSVKNIPVREFDAVVVSHQIIELSE